MVIGNISVIVAIFITLLLNTCKAMKENSFKTTITRRRDLANVTLFNFTDFNTNAFENWIEVSDATVIGGRSKATLVRLKRHTSGEREQVRILFRISSSYLHGAPQCNSKFSGLTQKSRIGIEVYGGSNASKNQFGPGAIEIFTISAYKEKSNASLKKSKL
ncbi:unnamed protein product [Schistosoma margrebowiei]|uniref:Uncharacterized protein n=1 Tax=Schistosoma margrebowiei TaxID=48269 RepID=A0A183LHZ9_9TREM|nr:unnamed protein product [Schistosoma margrebowiei]